MKDQIGFVGFFQRRTERRYQIMRKVLYKSYGIRKDDFFAARRSSTREVGSSVANN